jgi:hypothetical protein
MKFTGLRQARYAFGEYRSQIRMARKYGGLREALTDPLSARWDRLWLCQVRGQHREKFASRGRCYRCGKPMR